MKALYSLHSVRFSIRNLTHAERGCSCPEAGARTLGSRTSIPESRTLVWKRIEVYEKITRHGGEGRDASKSQHEMFDEDDPGRQGSRKRRQQSNEDVNEALWQWKLMERKTRGLKLTYS